MLRSNSCGLWWSTLAVSVHGRDYCPAGLVVRSFGAVPSVPMGLFPSGGGSGYSTGVPPLYHLFTHPLVCGGIGTKHCSVTHPGPCRWAESWGRLRWRCVSCRACASANFRPVDLECAATVLRGEVTSHLVPGPEVRRRKGPYPGFGILTHTHETPF